LLDVYVIVNAVDGLASGSYYFSPGRGELELLREGDFREEAGHLCFEQALGADASVVAFFMADLAWVLARYGNRGYRAAQLEAGIVGGNMYLCAHGLGLGATGMTFYDDEVTEFFSPHAAGKSLMFLTALGVKDRRNRVRPFRSRVGVLLDSLARGAGGTLPSSGG
jgi:SagB-type dehydrogenase family enzyme